MKKKYSMPSNWVLPILLAAATLCGQPAVAETPPVAILAAAQSYLAQKIATNYLYLASVPFHADAEDELRLALNDLHANQPKIKADSLPPGAAPLTAMDEAVRGMEELTSQQFDPEHAQRMIDYSESLTKEAGDLAILLTGEQQATLPLLVYAQRMHNERVAKYYLTEQFFQGISGNNMLDEAIGEFNANLTQLTAATAGNRKAAIQVEKIERLSRSMRRLMSEDRGGRTARVVLVSCRNISHTLDRLEQILTER